MARTKTITTKSSREKRCRKNIAKLLTLMGFQDDDPQTTIQAREIKDLNKKLSFIREFVIKCAGFARTSVIVPRTASHEPPHNSEPPVIVAAGAANNIDENGGMELMEFVKEIGGSEVKLVIEKDLTLSDVLSNQGRLLIPVMKIKNSDFLTKDEKKKLEKSEISVWVFDLKRRKSTLNLREWSMRSSKNYVLKTGWNQVVATNGLQCGMVIRVSSFRIDEQLCFALSCV